MAKKLVKLQVHIKSKVCKIFYKPLDGIPSSQNYLWALTLLLLALFVDGLDPLLLDFAVSLLLFLLVLLLLLLLLFDDFLPFPLTLNSGTASLEFCCCCIEWRVLNLLLKGPVILSKIEEWWLFKFEALDVEDDELPAFGSEDFPTPCPGIKVSLE